MAEPGSDSGTDSAAVEPAVGPVVVEPEPVASADPAPDAGTVADAGPVVDAGAAQPAAPAKGRAGKGRKGRNRRGRNRGQEAPTPAAPVVEDPESTTTTGPEAGAAPHVAATATTEPDPTETGARESIAPEVSAPGRIAPQSTPTETAAPGSAAAGITAPGSTAAESTAPGSTATEFPSTDRRAKGAAAGAVAAGATAEATTLEGAAPQGTTVADPTVAGTATGDTSVDAADIQHTAPEPAAPENGGPPAGTETVPDTPVAGSAETVAESPEVAAHAARARDDSGRDGSARRSPPRTAPTDDPTTVVAAPGLGPLGKRSPAGAAQAGPAPEDSSAHTTAVPNPVRALAKVVRPGPGQADGRKRIAVLAVAALVLIAAVVFMATRNTEGDGSPQDRAEGGASQGATSPAATGPTSAEPTSEPAAPVPSVTSTDTATAQPGNQRPPLPPGWREHKDRTGFSVYVPAHWQESREDGMVYFRGDGRTLGIDQTDTPQPNPVADWQGQRDRRRAEGDFPGYSEIRIVEVPYFIKAADWEFTFRSGGGISHVNNRGVIVGQKKAYGFWWQTSDADWATAAPILQTVYASFLPDPSKVG